MKNMCGMRPTPSVTIINCWISLKWVLLFFIDHSTDTLSSQSIAEWVECRPLLRSDVNGKLKVAGLMLPDLKTDNWPVSQ